MKLQNLVSKFLFAAAAIFLLSGCAELSRSPDSGYAYRESERDLRRERKAAERSATLSQMGVKVSRELTDDETQVVDNRSALLKAEKALEGKREREQYFRNKPFMKSDRERMEFLSLGSYEDRSRWLNAKGIQASTTQHPPEIQNLIDVNDITLGMTKSAVRDSWGEPDNVEVAGNPMYGNERWHYTEQTSSTEGYHTQNRLVYFESGRVVGWESR